jgi:hypothetical protein
MAGRGRTEPYFISVYKQGENENYEIGQYSEKSLKLLGANNNTAGLVGDDRAPGGSASFLAVVLLFARRCLRSRVVLGETA